MTSEFIINEFSSRFNDEDIDKLFGDDDDYDDLRKVSNTLFIYFALLHLFFFTLFIWYFLLIAIYSNWIRFVFTSFLSLIISYLPTPPLGQDMTQGQFFKRSLTGLNSEFSLS